MIYVGLHGITERTQQFPGEMEASDMEEAQQLWASIVRCQRNYLLKESDWIFAPDVSISSQDRAALITYRQQLRDIPQQPGFPDVTWPIIPSITADAGNHTGEQS